MWTDEVIKKGSKGELVTNVQNGLLTLGYAIGKADGIYGDLTKTAVLKFQSDHSLDQDGIMGPITGKVLEKYYNKKVAEQKAAASAKGAPVKGAPVKGAPKKGK